jgi:hypothetical protein
MFLLRRKYANSVNMLNPSKKARGKVTTDITQDGML